MIDTLNYPKISIVIPSFNQGQYIEQTLVSVIGQQYPNLEIIVIDGGSSDETLEVIKKYSGSITYFISEPDNGQVDAINKGFRLAQGDILGWLNSDDMYLPCTLLRIANLFNNPHELKLVYGGCLQIYEDSSQTFGYLPKDFDRERLTYYDYIVQPSTFWSRSLWETVGPLNEKYHYVLDWEWFIRASKVCDFILVKNYLSIYRYHKNHKTSNGGDKRAKEILEIIHNNANDYWVDIYEKVYKKRHFLMSGQKILTRFRANSLRHLLSPKLFLQFGGDTIDTTLYMFNFGASDTE